MRAPQVKTKGSTRPQGMSASRRLAPLPTGAGSVGVRTSSGPTGEGSTTRVSRCSGGSEKRSIGRRMRALGESGGRWLRASDGLYAVMR